MEKRRQNSEAIKAFYAPKDEETAADSEDEEDEVLDIHKQKSEVIFWNDPRIGMKKKDIHLSTLVRQTEKINSVDLSVVGQVHGDYDHHGGGL